MKKIIAIVLIIVGIIFISIPYASKMIIARNTQSGLDLLEELNANDLKANESQEAEFDFSLVRDIDINSILKNTNDNYKNAIVGHILIDDLEINLPVLKGTTDPHLMVGATTMRPDQQMGVGNYPLAGHLMRDRSRLFGHLLEIEKGHIVKLTNKETIYEYEIYDTKIVPDTSFYILEDKIAKDRGKPVISLMTCYYDSRNGKRFFAFGELVDEYPFELEKLAK